MMIQGGAVSEVDLGHVMVDQPAGHFVYVRNVVSL